MIEWIHFLNQFSSAWAEVLWRAVWQGSLVIIFVWGLACLTFRAVPASMRCWLWRIALLKLGLALIWLNPIRLPLLPSRSVFHEPSFESSAALNRFQLNDSRMTALSYEQEPVEQRDGSTTWDPAQKPHFSFEAVLLLLWSAGVSIWALRTAQHWRKANQLIQGAHKRSNDHLIRLCETIAAQLRCQCVPTLMYSTQISIPLVIGIHRPVILLPDAVAEKCSLREARLMLAHELAHVRRRDLLWALVAAVVQGFFFFHPLVWLANRESRLAQEIACDELVISCARARPAEYAAMLVDVASGVQSLCTGPLVVGVVESYRTLKRRLKAMKYIRAKSKSQLGMAAVLTAILGAGIVLPWQLVAQNAPAAPLPIPAPPPALAPAPPPATPPALVLPEDDIATPAPPAKPATSKRKRATANVAPAALPATGSVVGRRDEIISEDDGDLSVRGGALTVDVGPGLAPRVQIMRSKVGQAQESNESRDQVLRYKLIFKSGLARLRHLLNQQSPDESDVETALNLVGRLEHQLVDLSEKADNRDLASTGKVIQEQLTELNAAVGAATSEKTPPMRAKRLTRAKAIVEGLTELVPDIDALGVKGIQVGAVQNRLSPGYGGGGYGAAAGSYPR